MDNKEVYKTLGLKEKQNIEMYLTARQFEYAILEEEIIVIPQKASNNLQGILQWGETKITIRGDKNLVRIYPYIVNKSFACEVYLKLILSFEKNINCRKVGHNIYELFMKTSGEFKSEFYETFKKEYGERADMNFLDNEIKKISNIFIEWRYIYEKIGREMNVNYGFVNEFCHYLNRYNQQKILDKYGYDVDKTIK